MGLSSTRTGFAGGTLDWIVEELTTARTAPSRPVPLVTPNEFPPALDPNDFQSAALRFMDGWIRDLGVDRTSARVLEFGPVTLPSGWKVREHTVLLSPSEEALDLAGRFPRTRFFLGPLATVAALAAGRFDLAIQVGPARFEDVECRDLSIVASLIRKRGLLFSRSRATSQREWARTHADFERAQLRLMGCEHLADRSLLLVSRRR